MGKVSIAAWSRYMALFSAFALWAGGIIGLFYSLQGIAIYSIVIGVLVQAFEYPVPFVKFTGALRDVLYIRAVAYIILSAPACGIVPTTAGGFFLFLSGWWYIWAAMRGETWPDPFAGGRGEDGGGGGGGGRKKEDDKAKPAQPNPANNPLNVQVPQHKPVFASSTQYDSQGYAIETGGGSSATYSPPAPAAPAPVASRSAPPPRPVMKPSARASQAIQQPQPPAATYADTGADGQAYDAAGYDDSPAPMPAPKPSARR